MLRITRGNKKDIPDHILLEKYRITGDLELLGELYSRYMPLVYGVCLKYLQDREEAKDAVMDVFEKLVIEFKLYVIKDIKSWLYVLTRNFCLMELRKKKTERKYVKDLPGNQYDFMESSEELHPIDRERIDNQAALKECIRQLKEEQKACITLFYFENKSYREISLRLKLDEKKVKSHLQNGKRNLKICLEGINVKR